MRDKHIYNDTVKQTQTRKQKQTQQCPLENIAFCQAAFYTTAEIHVRPYIYIYVEILEILEINR